MVDCSKCGAKTFSWLGGHHKCPSELFMRKFENNGWIDVPDLNAAEEYDAGWMLRGRANLRVKAA